MDFTVLSLSMKILSANNDLESFPDTIDYSCP